MRLSPIGWLIAASVVLWAAAVLTANALAGL